MAEITITAVTWSNPQPDSYKIVMVAYRLSSMPDTANSYIIVSTGSFVSTTGLFLIPVVITGLDITKIYTVKVISLCGGFTAYRDFDYQPPAAFSNGFSLGFES